MEEVIELLYATAGNNVKFEAMFKELQQKMEETYEKQLGKLFPDDKLVGQADAFTDILYFGNGGFAEMGVNPDPLFSIVHGANMAKIFPDGKPHYNEVGKVIKPPQWQPPEEFIEEEIKRQLGK